MNSNICGMVFNRINFNSFSIYPCCFMENKNEVYNCYQAKETWMSTHFNNIRNALINHDYHSYCSSCPYVLGGINFPSEYNLGENIDVNHITLSMDQTCNLTCKTCRTSHIQENPFADSILSATQVFSDTITTVNIAGDGEVFASNFYMKILKDDITNIYPNTKYIELHTNGTLFNEINYAKINECNRRKISKIILSIDAASNHVYTNVRGFSFEKLIMNIEFIKTLGIPIESYFTISKLNKHECIDFIDLSIELGIYKVFFWHLRDWGRNNYHQLYIDEVELKTLKEQINTYINTKGLLNIYTCL